MHACTHTHTHIVAAKKGHKILYLAHNCTYDGRGTYMYMYHTCFACQYPTQLENRDIHATHCITCKERMTYNINNALGYSVCPQLLRVPSSLYKKEKDFVNSQGCSIKSTQNSLLSYMKVQKFGAKSATADSCFGLIRPCQCSAALGGPAMFMSRHQ